MFPSPSSIIYQHKTNYTFSITATIRPFVRLFFKTIPDFISLHSKIIKYIYLREKDALTLCFQLTILFFKTQKIKIYSHNAITTSKRY